MDLRDAAQQALEFIVASNKDSPFWLVPASNLNKTVTALRAALADTQDWDEVEALRASLREHMAEILRLRAAGRQALGALQFCLPLIEDYGDEEQLAIHHKALAGLTEYAMQRLTDVQQEMEAVTYCHSLEQARAAVISNLLAHFSITSADSDVNLAYLNKQLDDLLEASIGCNKEGGKLAPPLKRGEECEYPWCLSPNGCERQCPAFPRCEDSDTGKKSDVPETNFGNMAQAVDSTRADHIADANKMVPTINEMETVEPVAYVTGYRDGFCVINPVEHVVFPTGMALYRSPPTCQESRQVEPVAWMVYALDGQSAFVTDNPADFTLQHRALPLYTAPPKREPLTNDEIRQVVDRIDGVTVSESVTFRLFARAIERAHGIGG